ncbi:MAG TPA: methylated-DNA--[protein]-cysteine S-methyltransferase [Candidatus Limnocylindrales bacterium]
MNTSTSGPGTGLSQVEDSLRELRTSAPPTLLPATLAAVGLADVYAALPSAIGQVWVAWNGRGVSALMTAPDAAAFEAAFRRAFDRPIRRVEALPPSLARAIARRLAGDRRVRIDVDLRGRTEFEQAVWRKALEIPRGEVRPYGWIACEIGHPAAVRAVGTALGHNPVPLLIPCHRVVRSDGHIGQYSLGGAENKRALLAWEGADPDELERLARAGIRYFGSDTTRIVCHPTCHHARRVTDRHRMTFRSMDEAARSGYRPCKVCRPVAHAA